MGLAVLLSGFLRKRCNSWHTQLHYCMLSAAFHCCLTGLYPALQTAANSLIWWCALVLLCTLWSKFTQIFIPEIHGQHNPTTWNLPLLHLFSFTPNTDEHGHTHFSRWQNMKPAWPLLTAILPSVSSAAIQTFKLLLSAKLTSQKQKPHIMWTCDSPQV